MVFRLALYQTIWLICLFLAYVKNQNLKDNQDNLLIKISDGYVRGEELKTASTNKTYVSFQGMPYAQPPIGNLRFKAPVAASNWDDILNATDSQKICVQGYPEVIGSEDCLYINVFTPKVNAKLPVMVWIYGGYFLGGDSKIQTFGPDYLIEEDVVVVTFNYRTGIFGFLATEDDVCPGNFGLKDQILALKWVQSNIAFFGGNPKNVTLFGQSAGSGAVSYLTLTPLTKGLFQRAIMQSGSSLNLWSLSRTPKLTAFVVGHLLGIFAPNSQTLIKRLRTVDYRLLQTISLSENLAELVLTNPLDGLIFAPVLEPIIEGAVVTNRSYVLLENGNFNRVPCIVGYTSAEAIFFEQIINFVKLYLITFDLAPVRLIPIDMNLGFNLVTQAVTARLIKDKYFGSTPIISSNDSLVKFISDDQFARPITELVRLMSRYVPIYFYKFSYEGVIGNSNRSTAGVAHAEDLNYLWFRNDVPKVVPPHDLLVRKRLIKLWTNFAKTSNPTPAPNEILQNITWPESQPGDLLYLDIGRDFQVKSNSKDEDIKFWTDLYKQYGHPPYDTY